MGRWEDWIQFFHIKHLPGILVVGEAGDICWGRGCPRIPIFSPFFWALQAHQGAESKKSGHVGKEKLKKDWVCEQLSYEEPIPFVLPAPMPPVCPVSRLLCKATPTLCALCLNSHNCRYFPSNFLAFGTLWRKVRTRLPLVP